jgi:transitional endoplasmic reticulum ATPase
MANHEVFNAYRSHASGHRISTNTALQTAILSQYPDHCLTATSHDLIKYADAGHASAIVVQDGPPNLFNRDYDSNLRRSNDGDPSTMLKTVIVFAFYDYSWQGHEYRVLVAEGQNSLLSGPCDRRFYILSKPHAGEVAGKSLSKAADELILAVGIWVENSDDEVWVFDQGRWVKDKALWVGAQDADFDAIIMPPEMKSAIMRDVMGFFDAKEHYREFGTPWKVISLFRSVSNTELSLARLNFPWAAGKWKDYDSESNNA